EVGTSDKSQLTTINYQLNVESCNLPVGPRGMPPPFSWQGRCHFLRRRILPSSSLDRDPRAQHLSDAPRLRDAAAGREWRLRVEHFADRSDARIVEVRQKTLERGARAREIVGIDLQPCIDERTGEPRPHRPLVIGGVARAEVAEVVRLV